jgi:hypothetical protein
VPIIGEKINNEVVNHNISYLHEEDIYPFWTIHPTLSGVAVYLIIYSFKIFRSNNWATSLAFGIISPLSTIRFFIYLSNTIDIVDKDRSIALFVLDFFCFGRMYFLFFVTQLFICIFPSFYSIFIKIRFYTLCLGIVSPLTYWFFILLCA